MVSALRIILNNAMALIGLGITAVVSACTRGPDNLVQCDLERPLLLQPQQSFQVRQGTLPVALLALSSDSLLVGNAGSAGAEIVVSGRAETEWINAPEPLNLLVREEGEILGGGVSRVYRIDLRTRAAAPIAEVPVRAGALNSIAASREFLWAASADRLGQVSEMHFAARGRLDAWRTVRTGAPVRLAAAGHEVFAARMQAPHTLLRYDTTGTVIDSVVPARRRLFDQAGRTEPPTATQALIPLDCGALLHLVVDLHSGGRALYLYDTRGRLRVVRRRMLPHGAGLVHAMPAEPLLVGMSAGQGWWEAVLLRWSWNSN